MYVPKFRLLPLTIYMMVFTLMVKSVGLFYEGQELYRWIGISESVAAAKEPESSTNDKIENTATESASADSDKKSKDGTETAELSEQELLEQEQQEKGEIIDPANRPSKLEEQIPFTKMEINLLKRLNERREQIDEWERQVDLREKMLMATEKKLDVKLSELKDLKTNIESLLTKYDEQEEEKIRSLVKIYESMKPKRAAVIFEEIDMPVLLRVVDKMKEKKAAPILSYMSPKRAKEITENLAEQRKLISEQISRNDF